MDDRTSFSLRTAWEDELHQAHMDVVTVFLKKHKDFLVYMVFGTCATGINMGSYALLYRMAGIPNVPATAMAWLFAVSFAFISNKLIVFASRSFAPRLLLFELASFFGCRIITGLLDVFIMWLTVDILGLSPLLWKFISNLIVGIVNFMVGKMVIFKDKKG